MADANIDDDNELLLDDDIDDQNAPEGDDGLDEGGEDGDEPETVIQFADDAEEGEEETPLVKRLRDQLREATRKNRRPAETTNDDPEPTVPDRPRSVSDFDYDEERFNAAIDAHLEAKDAHSEWKTRQGERTAARQRVAEEQTKRVEQQVRALGVGDYEDRAATVRDTLSDAQMAVMLDAADNPAQLVYALGRSQTRLVTLAGETSLAKFAAAVGRMEKEIKVKKRTAPPPERQVRGATASPAANDRRLAALEAKADKTGDSTELVAYKKSQKQRAA